MTDAVRHGKRHRAMLLPFPQAGCLLLLSGRSGLLRVAFATHRPGMEGGHRCRLIGCANKICLGVFFGNAPVL